jgi:hypothetical protein
MYGMKTANFAMFAKHAAIAITLQIHCPCPPYNTANILPSSDIHIFRIQQSLGKL